MYPFNRGPWNVRRLMLDVQMTWVDVDKTTSLSRVYLGNNICSKWLQNAGNLMLNFSYSTRLGVKAVSLVIEREFGESNWTSARPAQEAPEPRISLSDRAKIALRRFCCRWGSHFDSVGKSENVSRKSASAFGKILLHFLRNVPLKSKTRKDEEKLGHCSFQRDLYPCSSRLTWKGNK